MDTDMADFRTKILDPSDKQLECETCKFIESGLIRWKTAGTDAVRISCRECHVYEDPLRYKGQFKMVFENEMTSVSIAHMSRMVAAFVHTELWSAELAQLVNACLQEREIPEIPGIDLDTEKRSKLAKAITAWLDAEPDDDVEVIEETLRQKFAGRAKKIGVILSKVLCDQNKIVGDDWADIEAARQLMSPDERKILDWSVRYIPIAFEPSRVKGWRFLKAAFFKELTSIAALRARIKKSLEKYANSSQEKDVNAAVSTDPFANQTDAYLAKIVKNPNIGTALRDMPVDPASHMEGKNEEN
jgi:hypothetical protein